MHLSVDPAAPVYRHSSFLHGYAHGYEMGFHNGDLDVHMGRNARDPKSIKGFKDGKKTFRDGFGTRDPFVKGYEAGFRVGYGDAYGLRNFRAAQEVRSLAQQFQDGQLAEASSASRKSAQELDKGIAEGYKHGLASGLSDARNSANFRVSPPPCENRNGTTLFCDGQRLGYELGYSDGYNNQRKPDTDVKTASD